LSSSPGVQERYLGVEAYDSDADDPKPGRFSGRRIEESEGP
jgi:hypothetical protein